jgi:hypothetical protein
MEIWAYKINLLADVNKQYFVNSIHAYYTEERAISALKEELDKKFPDKWILSGDQYVSIESNIVGHWVIGEVYKLILE